MAPNTKPDRSDNPAGRALNRRVTISFPISAAVAVCEAGLPGADTGTAAGVGRTVDYTATPPGETNRYQVTVNGLYREGNLAVLKLGITCTLPVSQSCNAATAFIGSRSVPPITFAKNFLASSFSTFWSLGGFYLTDPTTGTEYIPVYQTSGEPLTAPLSNNMVPAETYPVWIYLSAPPPSTTAVTVSLPGGSPKIGNVPITPAPTLPGG